PSIEPITDTTALAAAAAARDDWLFRDAQTGSGNGLLGLGLGLLAAAFAIGLAIGTYRWLSRSGRSTQLVSIPMRVSRLNSQQPSTTPHREISVEAEEVHSVNIAHFNSNRRLLLV
uniref:CadC family transcriptional regulator n=1 Tax=Macrostomum lignano TaxID=282301 RepID=A0A1I8GMS9_9PLAT